MMYPIHLSLQYEETASYSYFLDLFIEGLSVSREGWLFLEQLNPIELFLQKG